MANAARIFSGAQSALLNRIRIIDIDDVEPHDTRPVDQTIAPRESFLVAVQLQYWQPIPLATRIPCKGFGHVDYASQVLGPLHIARHPVRVFGEP